MQEFISIFNSVVVQPLQRVYQVSVAMLPEVTFAVSVLFIGWIFALLLKKMSAKLLKALGLDIVSVKLGVKSFLGRGGINRDLSSLVGLAFYWLIIFSALIIAFEALGLVTVALFIKRIIFFGPKIFVALIILTLGIFLGHFVSKLVEKTSLLASLPLHSLLSGIANYTVIGLAIMLALEYLAVPTAMSVQFFLVIFALVPLAVFSLLLIGGRDIILSILAGRLIAREIKAGDKIEFDSLSGEVESISLVMTKIKGNKETIMIANSELVKKTIKQKSK